MTCALHVDLDLAARRLSVCDSTVSTEFMTCLSALPLQAA